LVERKLTERTAKMTEFRIQISEFRNGRGEPASVRRLVSLHSEICILNSVIFAVP
jgi:hypothetical protein